jgi:hypothetical protein
MISMASARYAALSRRYPLPVRSISLSVAVTGHISGAPRHTPRLLSQLTFSRAGSLHIDDVSVTLQHDLQPGLQVLNASENFRDCAADREAAASWLLKKDFQAPPPPPHSSCLQVLHHALKLGDREVGNADGLDVTLALQLSIDRLENIRTLLSVWDGELTFLPALRQQANISCSCSIPCSFCE